MAVGWQAMFEGPALLEEPDTGVMEIDAAAARGTVNGKPADLFMAMYLNAWLTAEMARNDLESGHLRSASVRIAYERLRGEQADAGRLSASCHVVFDFGEARGSFSNEQTLLRYIDVPGDKWDATMYQSHQDPRKPGDR